MDFIRFGILVDKYPWLPRILRNWDALREGLSPDNGKPMVPSIVGDLYGPREVKKIRRIAIMRWQTLNLDQTRIILDDSPLIKGIRVDAHVEQYAACYFHAPGQKQLPFTSCITNSGEFKPSHTRDIHKSVGQLIREIESNEVILDAVVLVKTAQTTARASGISTAKKLATFMEMTGEWFAYDIYIPSKQK